MQYRCHQCGELIESHHTNYKHAKGYHPNDNPKHDVNVARKNDHCANCQALRTYDPVAARKRDLVVAAGGPDSSIISDLQRQIETLTAQAELQKQSKATIADLQEQVASLAESLEDGKKGKK